MDNPIRNFFEKKLNSYAITSNLPIALQNVAFNRPLNGIWLECFLLPTRAWHREVTANKLKICEIGIFQVNVWVKNGYGMGAGEDVAKEIVNLFPVLPKLEVSIEYPGNIGKALAPEDVGFTAIPITFEYKYN